MLHFGVSPEQAITAYTVMAQMEQPENRPTTVVQPESENEPVQDEFDKWLLA